jgi:hypothetical protein
MNTTEDRLSHYRLDLDAAEPAVTRSSATESFATESITLNRSTLHEMRWRRRGDRRALALAATAVLVIIGLVAIQHQSSHTPGAGSGSEGFSFRTSRVTFDAASFTIDVGGQQYSPTGNVEVHGDPGDAQYATLELSWNQHGVEMRANIYFASDGADWWVSEMRTYNGKTGNDANWVTFPGQQFRTRLGTAYDGNVDETATEDGVTSHLRIGGMRLAYLPSAATPTQSTPSATNYGTIPVPSTTAAVHP